MDYPQLLDGRNRLREELIKAMQNDLLKGQVRKPLYAEYLLQLTDLDAKLLDTGIKPEGWMSDFRNATGYLYEVRRWNEVLDVCERFDQLYIQGTDEESLKEIHWLANVCENAIK